MSWSVILYVAAGPLGQGRVVETNDDLEYLVVAGETIEFRLAPDPAAIERGDWSRAQISGSWNPHHLLALHLRRVDESGADLLEGVQPELRRATTSAPTRVTFSFSSHRSALGIYRARLTGRAVPFMMLRTLQREEFRIQPAGVGAEATAAPARRRPDPSFPPVNIPFVIQVVTMAQHGEFLSRRGLVGRPRDQDRILEWEPRAGRAGRLEHAGITEERHTEAVERERGEAVERARERRSEARTAREGARRGTFVFEFHGQDWRGIAEEQVDHWTLEIVAEFIQAMEDMIQATPPLDLRTTFLRQGGEREEYWHTSFGRVLLTWEITTRSDSGLVHIHLEPNLARAFPPEIRLAFQRSYQRQIRRNPICGGSFNPSDWLIIQQEHCHDGTCHPRLILIQAGDFHREEVQRRMVEIAQELAFLAIDVFVMPWAFRGAGVILRVILGRFRAHARAIQGILRVLRARSPRIRGLRGTREGGIVRGRPTEADRLVRPGRPSPTPRVGTTAPPGRGIRPIGPSAPPTAARDVSSALDRISAGHGVPAQRIRAIRRGLQTAGGEDHPLLLEIARRIDDEHLLRQLLDGLACALGDSVPGRTIRGGIPRPQQLQAIVSYLRNGGDARSLNTIFRSVIGAGEDVATDLRRVLIPTFLRNLGSFGREHVHGIPAALRVIGTRGGRPRAVTNILRLFGEFDRRTIRDIFGAIGDLAPRSQGLRRVVLELAGEVAPRGRRIGQQGALGHLLAGHRLLRDIPRTARLRFEVPLNRLGQELPFGRWGEAVRRVDIRVVRRIGDRWMPFFDVEVKEITILASLMRDDTLRQFALDVARSVRASRHAGGAPLGRMRWMIRRDELGRLPGGEEATMARIQSRFQQVFDLPGRTTLPSGRRLTTQLIAARDALADLNPAELNLAQRDFIENFGRIFRLF